MPATPAPTPAPAAVATNDNSPAILAALQAITDELSAANEQRAAVGVQTLQKLQGLSDQIARDIRETQAS